MNEDIQDMSEDVLQDGRQDGPGPRHLRLSVLQAADRLGITQDAVRKRIKRGYIGWEKDEDGRLYVWVDPTETQKETSRETSSGTSSGGDDVLLDYVQTLKKRIEHLEEESRRKDTIIMTMAQRIPELEPASEPRESAEPASGGVEGVEPSERENKEPWWRRLFK